MRRQPWAQAVVAAETLQDAFGEEALAQLAELEVAAGGEGGGLDDDGVACEEGGRDLAAGQEDGVVPGDDADGGPQGHVADEDASGVVVEDFFGGEGEGRGGAEDLEGEVEFEAGEVQLGSGAGVLVGAGHGTGEWEGGVGRGQRAWGAYRFALLLDEELSEVLLLSFDGVGEGVDGLATLLVGGVCPATESSLGCGNCSVDVFGGGDRDWIVGLRRCGVDAGACLFGGGQLAIYDVTEDVPVKDGVRAVSSSVGGAIRYGGGRHGC